jgi:hypothetical protein
MLALRAWLRGVVYVLGLHLQEWFPQPFKGVQQLACPAIHV